jgi:hypothetical protein
MRSPRPLAGAFYSVAWIFLAGTVAGLTVRSSGAMSRGFDTSDLDTTCKPCADFYQYATGGWRAHNPIPPAYSSWGQFNLLGDRNQQILRQILEHAAQDRHSAPGSIEQKIGDFYGSCMDEARIEAAGSRRFSLSWTASPRSQARRTWKPKPPGCKRSAWTRCSGLVRSRILRTARK